MIMMPYSMLCRSLEQRLCLQLRCGLCLLRQVRYLWAIENTEKGHERRRDVSLRSERLSLLLAM